MARRTRKQSTPSKRLASINVKMPSSCIIPSASIVKRPLKLQSIKQNGDDIVEKSNEADNTDDEVAHSSDNGEVVEIVETTVLEPPFRLPIVQFRGFPIITKANHKRFFRKFSEITPGLKCLISCFNKISLHACNVAVQPRSERVKHVMSNDTTEFLKFLDKNNYQYLHFGTRFMLKFFEKMATTLCDKQNLRTLLNNKKCSLMKVYTMCCRYKRAINEELNGSEMLDISVISQFISGFTGESTPLTMGSKLSNSRMNMISRIFNSNNIDSIVRRQYENSDQNPILSLNCILEILLSNHLIFHGVNKRGLGLSDLSFQEVECGSSTYSVLNFDISDHKTETENKTVAIARHKSPSLCLVSAVMFSLWLRFDIFGCLSDEYTENGSLVSEIDFSEVQVHSNAKLLFDKAGFHINCVSYEYECELVRNCLQNCDLDNISKSYLNDGYSEVALDIINSMIQNRVTQSVRSNGLSSMTFIDTVHCGAGFDRSEKYSVERSLLEPPTSLKRQIFPWLDIVIERFENKIRSGENFNDNDIFINILQQARTIILQDLVFLLDATPGCFFAKQNIVKDPEFIKFSKKLKKLCKKSNADEVLHKKIKKLEYQNKLLVNAVSDFISMTKNQFDLNDESQILASMNAEHSDSESERLDTLQSFSTAPLAESSTLTTNALSKGRSLLSNISNNDG